VVPKFSVMLQLNAPGDVADYNTATIAVGLASAAGVDASRVEVWLAAGSVLIRAKISADSSAQAEALATSLAPAFASPAEAGATLGFQVESVHTPPTVMLDGARVTGQPIPPPSPVASPPAPSPAGEDLAPPQTEAEMQRERRAAGYNPIKLNIKTAHVAHGLMLVAAWGLLIPSGAFVSAGWRHRLRNGAWLKAHRAMQTLGLLLTLVGVALGVMMTPSGFHFSDPHHVGGVVIAVLAVLHPLNSIFRGKPAGATGGVRTLWRLCWELLHKGGGYLLIAAGGYQCYSGYLLMRDGLWLLALYCFCLGFSALVLLLGLAHRFKTTRNPKPTVAGVRVSASAELPLCSV